MGAPLAEISEADRLATPVAVRALILAHQQEIDQLSAQLPALDTEMASLGERIGCSYLNSSKPPFSNGPWFKPPERRKGRGRNRGAQPGVPPLAQSCCCPCGTFLQGVDSEPLGYQVFEISLITPMVIEHRLYRLVCPCCSTSILATLQADVEATRYGSKLSGLVGFLGGAFSLSFNKT
jgi:transposase